jgi:hypothetical protein
LAWAFRGDRRFFIAVDQPERRHKKRPATQVAGRFAFFWRRYFVCKALKIKGWHAAIKKFEKTPQAKPPHDDNYYVGSLGQTRRMSGPEAEVSIQRGFRHGFNSKHQPCIAERSKEPDPFLRRSANFDATPVFRPAYQQR